VDRPRPSRSEAETRSEKDSKPDRQAVPPPSSSERRAAPDGPRSGRRPARRKLRPRKPGYGSNLLVALAVIWVVIIAIGLLIIFLPGDKGTGDTDPKARPGLGKTPAPRQADRDTEPDAGPDRP
jgi:hypothetical protein